MLNNCSPSEDSICVERMNHSCYNNHHHHHHHLQHLQHLTSTLVSPSSCPKYTHPSPNTQLFIKTLSGKTMTLLVDLKKDTVLSVKEKIYQKTYIPALKQRLIHRQLQLEDHKKLSDYPTIGKDSTFHLVLRLVAGVNTKTTAKSKSKKTPIKTEEGTDTISNQIITSDNSSTSLTPTTAVVATDLTIPKPDDGSSNASTIINASSSNELVTTSSSSNNNNSTTTPATNRKSRSKSNASTKKSSKKSTPSSTTEIKVKEEPMEKDNNTIILASSDLNSIHSSPSENSTSPSSSTNPSSNSNALEAYSDESETDEDDSDSEGGKGRRSGKNKKRGSYTKRACINCRTAHAACDSGRPCKRCIQLGKADSCRDAERKRTKKRTLNEYENAPVFFPSLDSFIPLLSGLQPAPPLETVQKSDDTSNMSTNSETSDKKIKDEFTPKPTTRIKKEKEGKRKSKNQSSTEKKGERMDIMEISQPEKPLNSELAAIFAPDTSHSTFLDMESSPTTEQDVQMFFNDEDVSLDKREGNNLSEAFNTGVVLSPESNIEEVPSSTALALVPNNPDNQQLIAILQSYNGTLPFDLTEAISQSNNNEIVKMLLYEYLRQSQELRELKQLVTSLQFTLINLNPPQFSPNSSTPPLNDISNNTM